MCALEKNLSTVVTTLAAMVTTVNSKQRVLKAYLDLVGNDAALNVEVNFGNKVLQSYPYKETNKDFAKVKSDVNSPKWKNRLQRFDLSQHLRPHLITPEVFRNP